MKNLQLTLTFDIEGCLMRLDSYHDVRTVSRDLKRFDKLEKILEDHHPKIFVQQV